MTAEEMDKYTSENKLVEQTRPVWNYADYFTEQGKNLPVTFLICQKNTKSLIQLAIESLLRFYPDVNVLVVDDDSNDDSLLYLQYKQLVTPNLTVFEKKGAYLGHGGNMDLAIRKYVKTEFVMLMDSDVIIERGDFLYEMVAKMQNIPNLYALGSLQTSSYKNNGGEPESIEDITPYANPQLSLYHVPTYLKLNADFLNDGTPCILNMKAAKDAGLEVKYFPTDKFCTHNSGSSWTNPRTIWNDDHDVFIRPFVTFIINPSQMLLIRSVDPDFDVVIAGNHVEASVVIHGREPQQVSNDIYNLRFQVTGEYVCDAREYYGRFRDGYISDLKREIIKYKAPDTFVMDNKLKFIKRRVWQQNESLL